MPDGRVFAGVEGGASYSKVVLLDGNGRTLVKLDNEPSSNVWLMTEKEWAERIHKMVTKALNMLDKSYKPEIESLGLCLSGCENAKENQKLAQLLKSSYPNLSASYLIESDTIGSLMTCSPEGGIVLISGTGSNSLLVYPDETSVRCGGWGHMIGDYGSAYWISVRAIQYLIEHEENYNRIEFDINEIKKTIYEHFNVQENIGVLTPFYHKFDKSFIAQLCARIAKLANEKNDLLSRKIFQDAGVALAKHVKALLPSTKGDSVEVICVGSVFKSWPLIEDSFSNTLNGFCSDKSISIRYLTNTSAIGAAYLAAKKIGVNLSVDFENNYKLLCEYQKDKKIKDSIF